MPRRKLGSKPNAKPQASLMDDDTLRGVLGFASRAVQTKKAA